MSREHVQAIITQHAEAVRLLREASTAFDNAIAGLRVTLDAVAAANHAQGQAMAAPVAGRQVGIFSPSPTRGFPRALTSEFLIADPLIPGLSFG
jgi:hypothetical protein